MPFYLFYFRFSLLHKPRDRLFIEVIDGYNQVILGRK